MDKILEKLRLTVDNPGLYKPLTAEESAELFLYFLQPKPKLFKKPKIIKGIDGKTPVPDQDYISKETSLKFLNDVKSQLENKNTELEKAIQSKLESVSDGKDAEITDDLIATVASMASSLVDLPDFDILITESPEAIRNALELLVDEERLDVSAIKGLDDYDEVARLAKTPRTMGTGAVIARKLGQIGDVSIEGVTDGQALTYNQATKTWVATTISGGSGGHTIEDEGTPLTQRDTINFVGSGVTATDAGGKTVVTIPGGGSPDWGDIGGTLSNQTDLQSALDDKQNILAEGAFVDGDKDKLDNIEDNAEVNNISDVNATDLTDGGQTTLHHHDGRYYTETELDAGQLDGRYYTESEVDTFLNDKANATHTHTESDITDLDKYTQAEVDALLHSPVTVTDSSEINFTLTGQDITASLIAGSIDETKLDTSVNASLDLADSALQSADIADFETTTELNARDTANRNRANHTGTQTASTISDFDAEVANNSAVVANTAKISATGSELEPTDINTLAKLNAIVADATLIDTTDSRLSDARTPLAHTHATTDITSGTFADARIAQSNVTQHEGALSITESQISDLGTYLENVVEDTTPTLGGDLDADFNELNNVNRIDIRGIGAEYSAYPDSFLKWSGSYSYDYANLVVPHAVNFTGTHTIKQNGFIFGMGFLFNAEATIKNEGGTGRTFTSFYTLASQNNWQADNATVTHAFNIDIILQPKYEGINGGTYNLSLGVGQVTRAEAKTGGNITNYLGQYAQGTFGAGSVTSQAALVAENLSHATNNTELYLGAPSFSAPNIPTGNYSVYQRSTKLSHWNGGLRQTYRTATSTTTLDDTDHTLVATSGTFTVNLPNIVTADIGRIYYIKNRGGGTVTVDGNGADTIDGSATRALTSNQGIIIQAYSTSQWAIISSI